MRLNKEQAKHLADTARIIAIAQFAAFGYTALVDQHYIQAAIFTLLFVQLESLAVLLLEDK